jgi:hypothetical protein
MPVSSIYRPDPGARRRLRGHRPGADVPTPHRSQRTRPIGATPRSWCGCSAPASSPPSTSATKPRSRCGISSAAKISAAASSAGAIASSSSWPGTGARVSSGRTGVGPTGAGSGAAVRPPAAAAGVRGHRVRPGASPGAPGGAQQRARPPRGVWSPLVTRQGYGRGTVAAEPVKCLTGGRGRYRRRPVTFEIFRARACSQELWPASCKSHGWHGERSL